MSGSKLIDNIYKASFILAEIRRINVSKEMNEAEIAEMLHEEELLLLERHLVYGYIQEARDALVKYIGGHFTREEKNHLLKVIDEAIGEVG